MAKRLTTEEVIKRAKEVHGDKYDYSKLSYQNARVPVTIICKKHGEFERKAHYHLNGGGCPDCSEKPRQNTESFIRRAKEVHGDKYDYSKVDYKTNHTPVTIICKEHGEFDQSPVSHWAGHGCAACVGLKKFTLQDFIDKSRGVHGDKYDYSKVDYKNIDTDVIIICPLHGEFKQSPYSHSTKHGCPSCGGVGRKDTEKFIEEAREIHGDTFDYSQVEYINNREPIKITCKKHGEFLQTPKSHLNGAGCRKCYDESMRHTTDNFVKMAKEIHGDTYGYENVEYVDIITKVAITCKTHGDFIQTPQSHLQGNGCVRCGKTESMQEKELAKFLKQFTKVKRNDRKILGGKELDIVLPEYKIAIEYNGLYWHSTKFLSPNYHLDKTKACEEKGWRLIHIFEDEWTQKKDIVKSRLRNILGKTEKRLYARQCNVRQVEASEASKFLEENHIQGKVGSTHKYGLYRKEELVALMTFGGRRVALGAKPKKGEVELLRYCTKKGYSVVGGASKLLKNYILKEKPVEIVTYADRRWSNGDMYKEMGFHFEGETKPNYFYVVGNKREGRYKYRKSELIKQGFPEHLSEREITEDLELFRIFDCGTYKFKLIPK